MPQKMELRYNAPLFAKGWWRLVSDAAEATLRHWQLPAAGAPPSPES
jgi:hypothetical protein